MQLPPLGLYIHLPWCERKCPYCDFNSHEARDLPQQAYVDTLLADLQHDLPLAQGRVVQSLFIGGGTPGLFDVESIQRLLAGIRDRLEIATDLEATMEANPGSAEAEKFAGFRQVGINRLSIGVQSFDDHCLQSLGRIHDGSQARGAIAMARHAGFKNFNIDLMHGLPGQSLETALADLEFASACEPTHLSWYQLTIEPNTKFYSSPPVLPVEDVLADIQDAGEALLAGAGYTQYEVSAYSQAGARCRHNLNYWTFGDYLGIGAGAHGKITHPDGRITRYHKTRMPQDYLSASSGSFTSATQALSREDIVGEFMMNALRLNEGFSRDLFESRTGLEFAAIQSRIDQLVERELLEISQPGIRATHLGRRFLDSVIVEFFPGR